MKKVIILLSCILAAGAIIISLMFFHKESDEEIVLNEIKTGDEKEYEDIYRKACDDNGVIYVENSQGILSEKDDMFVEEDDKNSGYHPSTKGCKKLAISIAEYASNGVLTEKHKTTE